MPRLLGFVVLTLATASALLQPPPLSAQPVTRMRVISSPSGPVNDGFGHSVALGLVAAVGAPGDSAAGPNAGAAFVFGPLPNEQGQVLFRMDPDPARLSAGAAGDLFGWSVATTAHDLMVGAPGDSVGPGGNREPERWRARGAAYVYWASIFRPLFAYHWLQVARLQPAELQRDDAFGSQVAMDDSLVYVSAPGADVIAGNGSLVADAGAVWVYSCTGSRPGLFPTYPPPPPPSCAQVAKWTSPAGARPGGRFGAALSTSGRLLLVGEPGARSVWSVEHDQPVPGSWSFTFSRVAAGGAFEGATFGESVAAAESTAMVGEPERPASASPGAAASGAAWRFTTTTPSAPLWGVWGWFSPATTLPAQYGTAVAAAGELSALGPANGCRVVPLRACTATSDDGPPSPVLLVDGAGPGYRLPLPLPWGLRPGTRYGSALAAWGGRLLVGASGPLSVTSSPVPTGDSVVFSGPGRVYDYDILALDSDGDGMGDAFESTFGLDPLSSTGRDGAEGDPDGDGVINAAEHAADTHPTAVPTHTRYFAEGVSGSGAIGHFDTQFAIANPGTRVAHVRLTYSMPGWPPTRVDLAIPPRQSRKVRGAPANFYTQAAFATRVESDEPIVADRRVWWSGAGHAAYGSHAERAVIAPAPQWFLAEGATHSGFDLFYLLQNPGQTEARVRVRYLRPWGEPLEKTYTVSPSERLTIWVDHEQFDGLSGEPLGATDVSADVLSADDVPIVVERAMYLTPAGAGATPFVAGHESAGVTAPATRWLFAEGATGDYFDCFLLLANPSERDAGVRATYLLPDGRTFTNEYTVRAASRFNIWVDLETFATPAGGTSRPLADTAVSITLEVTNGVPIVAERAMWWPGPTAADWTEAHNAPGATAAATRWETGDGIVADAPQRYDTYYLIANPSDVASRVRVTLLFDDGVRAPLVGEFAVAARSRFNVDVRDWFLREDLAAAGFGAVFESLAPDAVAAGPPIVVEYAIYNDDSSGARWAAGGAALATPRP